MSRSELSVSTGLPSSAFTLLDHNGEIVATSTGASFKKNVRPGIYRIQVEAGPTTAEQLVTVQPGDSASTHVSVTVPTVTPVTGASTNQAHCGEASSLSVRAKVVRGHGSRLVVFVRTTEPDAGKAKVTLNDLDLLDASATSMLGKGAWTSGPGYQGAAVELEPGFYVLRSDVCDQSVLTVQGWTTLLFMPAVRDGRRWVPDPSAAVVHMIELGQRFEPYDFGSDEVFGAEMALDGLRKGQVNLPTSGWASLDRKRLRRNPMLGVYLAHAALAQRRPALSAVRRVVRDVRALLPGHPDGDALFCAIKEFERDDSATRIPRQQFPPMLRPSFLALIARDATEPDLLVDGSIVAMASSRQRQDSVWTRWERLDDVSLVDVASKVVDEAALAAVDVVHTEQVRGRTGPDTSESPQRSSRKAAALTPDAAALASVLTDLAAHREEDDERLSMSQLSRQVGLPVSKVRENLEAISDASQYDYF